MDTRTTQRQIKLAQLEETLYRLAAQLKSDRDKLLRTTSGTGMGMVAERMVKQTEKAYFDALGEYRGIKGAHASLPAGCGIH